MKLRTLATALAALSVSAVSTAQFQTTVNSAKVTTRVFNDFPDSTLTTVSTFPTEISFNDVLSSGSGFANRHQWSYSNDGGANSYALSGPNDFFNAAFDLQLTSSGGSRKEAGFMLVTNETGAGGTNAPTLSQNFIINSDAGEVVAFGDPVPFVLFGNNGGGNGYSQGSTIRLGYRYFRDTDNLYKVTLSASGYASQTRTLTNYNGYDFGTLGLPAGTTLNGYAQFTGAGQTGFAKFSNITPNNPVPEPASIAALGLGAAALLRRRRAR